GDISDAIRRFADGRHRVDRLRHHGTALTDQPGYFFGLTDAAICLHPARFGSLSDGLSRHHRLLYHMRLLRRALMHVCIAAVNLLQRLMHLEGFAPYTSYRRGDLRPGVREGAGPGATILSLFVQ